MSPIVRKVIGMPVEISAEARELLIHNPEILTGLFYALMFFDAEPELHAFIDSEIAQDPRLAAAYSALKALLGGAASGILSKRIVENLLQLMPMLRRGGVNIFRRLGYQRPAALYDEQVQRAIQSLQTDRPFYLPIEDQAAPSGSLLLGPSAAAPLAIGPPPSAAASSSGSLLLGPSAAAPLAIAPPPVAAASSSGPYIQPSTVFRVSGMNTMAPPGPLPRRGPGRPPGPSTKQPPLIRPNFTRIQLADLQPVTILPAKAPPGPPPKAKSHPLAVPKSEYVERLRRGDFEGSGLVKTSKNI